MNVKKNDYLLIVTSDHGNADYMFDKKNKNLACHTFIKSSSVYNM